MSRIRFLMEGVNMNAGHNGLSALIKKELKIDSETLAPGDLVMFLNKRGDKLKIIGHGGLVIGYLKMPNGTKIYKEAIHSLEII